MKPLGTHYGAITGIVAIGGREAVKALILPNLKLYEMVLIPELEEDGPKRREAEMCVNAIMKALQTLEGDTSIRPQDEYDVSTLKARVTDKVGELIASHVRLGGRGLANAIIQANLN